MIGLEIETKPVDEVEVDKPLKQVKKRNEREVEDALKVLLGEKQRVKSDERKLVVAAEHLREVIINGRDTASNQN